MTKRSITIAGHRTSISLEPVFWHALQRLADTRGESMARLVAKADEGRLADPSGISLSGTLRVMVLTAALAREI